MAGDNSYVIHLAQADTAGEGTQGSEPETSGADEHATEGDLHATSEGEHADASDGHGTEVHAEDGDHGSGVFPPFDVTTFGSQLLWLAITFGALYLLMRNVALPRIGEILEVRRDRIEGDLAEADRLRQKSDQAEEAYQTALVEARQKAHGIAQQTRDDIRADLDARRAKVESDLAARVAEAEERIQASKADALSNVSEIATDTAQALVTQLIGKVPVKTIRDAVANASKGA